ncbi:GlxA family transcriptional regulator [Deinococcus yavapaiensis]|uniref:AraC family transcriptional regulator with amidase-like domain n=1 Tax=Deinococcus yavapaiensis KR-236 TaxID=694435 RepID=A0A318S9R5_9DEIO|nr:helix-turn-helix domain-containing protein [Deinococcus yavapaiensis]PYE53822.1 AraC family transcriptional regulator with amidase-like domain [Deinococcus yavapaiensis KR-236]
MTDSLGFSNPPSDGSRPPRRVLVLVLPQVNVLDLGGPVQVFETAARFGAPYALEFHAFTTNVLSAQGLPLGSFTLPPTPCQDDLVLVPGPRVSTPAPGQPLYDPRVLTWLREAYRQGAEVASICSGAVALGEAGLLDGRRCTTHWSMIDLMRERYPDAHVQDGVLFTHDGRITTSAGIASGIDMALALIEREHGPQLTAKVARYLVVYLRRDASHGQGSVYLDHRTHLHPGVHRVQDHLAQHPTERSTLDALAGIARMSARGLTKAFRQHTGLTPFEYQQKLRLELAAQLMHDPRLTLEAIAARSGFDDPRHFRRVWRDHHGTSPSEARVASVRPS